MHQLVTRYFACLNLVFESVEYQYGIYVAERILHQNTVLEFRVQYGSPALQVLAVDELRVVDKARRAPHVTYRIVADLDIRRGCHLLEFLRHERRDIIEIPDTIGDQLFLNRLNEPFLEHALDDILRRAEHVVVLVTHLDLGQCGLVDVEGLIHQLHFLARLLIVPGLEIGFDVLIDVVRPVQYFELVRTVRTAAST